MINRLLHVCAALIIASLAAAADKPAAATIRCVDGTALTDVFISEDSLDGVKYRLGAPDGPEGGKKRRDVKAVDYADFMDIDHARATGMLSRGEHEKAAEGFLSAAKTTIYAPLRERCYLDAAEAYIAAKQPDKALAALKELETKAPRSVLLPRAVELAFTIHKGLGDLAAAQADVDRLKAAKDWGIESVILGATGQAAIYRDAKKLPEAAKEIAAIWGSAVALTSTSDEDDKDQYARLGEQLASDYGFAGQIDKALAVYQQLMYEEIGGNAQARAHLAFAKNLAQGAKDNDALRVAIDHAFLALVLPEGDTQVRTGAKALAKSILAAFDKAAASDPKLAEEVAQYRSYLNAL